MKEETLDGEDAWNCSKCKCARKATKRLIITRMPPILIIHLKRFATRGRWGDKLNTPIEFPLVHLNLTKYVPAPLTPQAGKPSKPEPPETTPPFIYDLYGVVNHFGTLSGGHYTSYVKDNHSGTWNGFDDSKATGVPEGQIAVRTSISCSLITNEITNVLAVQECLRTILGAEGRHVKPTNVLLC